MLNIHIGTDWLQFYYVSNDDYMISQANPLGPYEMWWCTLHNLQAIHASFFLTEIIDNLELHPDYFKGLVPPVSVSVYYRCLNILKFTRHACNDHKTNPTDRLQTNATLQA